jgi:N utilization substance protein B
MTTRRRKAREGALEALYQFDLIKGDPQRALADILRRKRPSANVASYLRRLFERTVAEQPRIDEVLSATLEKWKLNRLSCTDRAVLRLACCELLFFDDIPANVSIDEAVELARLYGDTKSGQFVNGVLDAIARRYPKSRRADRPATSADNEPMSPDAEPGEPQPVRKPR